MTAQHAAKAAFTPGPWHVNAIDSKHGRITGDETSTGWDKLQINGTNCTVASVYRARDARLIAVCPEMLSMLEEFVADQETMSPPYQNEALCERANALIRQAKGEK